MEKNLFRYFSLLLVSFSITTFGQSKLAEKAYCAENKTELANENINSKDIYNLRIKTGEALVNASTAHDVFKSDVINNKYKVDVIEIMEELKIDSEIIEEVKINLN